MENGQPRHRYEWNCPFCGMRLPGPGSVPVEEIGKICENTPQPEVFYFDRVTQSALALAKKHREKGALIFFEPSFVENEKVFFECLENADIVKYSREMLGRFRSVVDSRAPSPLEIETLGRAGLRYRLGKELSENKKWNEIRAYPVKRLKDTVGAGDWCSAGIIHILGKKGRKGLEMAEDKDIFEAMNFGQALSALNCHYERARGCMYEIPQEVFGGLIDSIREGGNPLEWIMKIEKKKRAKKEERELFVNVCPHCGK